MARPRNDPAAAARPRLAPPRDLPAPLLRAWHAEFDRFPPGYYTQCDVSAMRLYLQTLAEYDAAARRAANARNADARRDERGEVRAIRRQLIAMQRALRMFPSSRGDPAKQAGLARTPDPEPATPGEAAQEPAWKTIMREAGTLHTKQ